MVDTADQLLHRLVLEALPLGITLWNREGKILVDLVKLPNSGHTDSKPYPSGATYTNWELSVDRANTARRLMQANDIREDQVSQNGRAAASFQPQHR